MCHIFIYILHPPSSKVSSLFLFQPLHYLTEQAHLASCWSPQVKFFIFILLTCFFSMCFSFVCYDAIIMGLAFWHWIVFCYSVCILALCVCVCIFNLKCSLCFFMCSVHIVCTSHLFMCICHYDVAFCLWDTVLPVLILSLCAFQSLSLFFLFHYLYFVGSDTVVTGMMLLDSPTCPGSAVFSLNCYCGPCAYKCTLFESITVFILSYFSNYYGDLYHNHK